MFSYLYAFFLIETPAKSYLDNNNRKFGYTRWDNCTLQTSNKFWDDTNDVVSALLRNTRTHHSKSQSNLTTRMKTVAETHSRSCTTPNIRQIKKTWHSKKSTLNQSIVLASVRVTSSASQPAMWELSLPQKSSSHILESVSSVPFASVPMIDPADSEWTEVGFRRRNLKARRHSKGMGGSDNSICRKWSMKNHACISLEKLSILSTSCCNCCRWCCFFLGRNPFEDLVKWRVWWGSHFAPVIFRVSSHCQIDRSAFFLAWNSPKPRPPDLVRWRLVTSATDTQVTSLKAWKQVTIDVRGGFRFGNWQSNESVSYKVIWKPSVVPMWSLSFFIGYPKSNGRGELTASYRWTDGVWENSRLKVQRLQGNRPSCKRNLWNIPWIDVEKPKGCNVWPVRLGKHKVSTDYVRKPPWTLPKVCIGWSIELHSSKLDIIRHKPLL